MKLNYKERECQGVYSYTCTMDPCVTIRYHITECMEERVQWSHSQLPKMIESLERAWVPGLSGIHGFKYIADCVHGVLQFDSNMQNLLGVEELGTWLYLHNDEFWSPRGGNDVWGHLQYIYDKCMTDPYTGIHMRRYTPTTGCWDQIMIVNWEDWRACYEDQDRVLQDKVLYVGQSNMGQSNIEESNMEESNMQESNVEENNMVDEVMIDFGDEEMDADRLSTKMTDEVMNYRDEIMED